MTAASKTILLLSVLTFFTQTGHAVLWGEEKSGTLIEKLTTFQKINKTLFVERNALDESQIIEMSEDALRSNLKEEYKNVGCSYLAACLAYMKSVRGLLSISLKHSEDFRKLITNYYYGTLVVESFFMVATSVNTAELNFVKDLMWIFNVYAQWLDDRFAHAETDEFYVSEKIFSPAHRALSKLLYQEVKSMDCPKILDESINLKSMKLLPASQLIPEDIQSSLLAFRKDYKKPLFNQLMEYETTHLMSWAGWQSCGMKQLCLNYIVLDKLALRNLHEKFGMMKEVVFFNGISESSFYLVCSQRTLNLPDTISELGKFQHNFIQMLKVIMVRIIWYYMESAKNSRVAHKYLYSMQIINILENFVAFLDLHNDVQMKKLVDIFDNHQTPKPIASILNTINLNFFTNGIEALIGILEELPKCFVSNIPDYNISFTEDILENKETDIGNINEIVSTNNVVINEDIRDMPESIYRALVFLKYVKLKFEDINFKIVRDLYKTYYSETHIQLWALHEGLSQP